MLIASSQPSSGARANSARITDLPYEQTFVFPFHHFSSVADISAMKPPFLKGESNLPVLNDVLYGILVVRVIEHFDMWADRTWVIDDKP